MSLSAAISHALSGMRASSAAAEVAGNNLANATNENFARRELVVQSNSTGSGGVQIVGIYRHNDPVMAAMWRDTNAAVQMSAQQSTHANAIQSLYGDPTQPGSLTNRLTQFQESLISAAARPDQAERLGAAVSSMDALVQSVNDIGDGIQAQRESADQQISHMADRMNDILEDLQSLNVRIASSVSSGNDPSALLDMQEQLVDELSGMTDIRVYTRDHNTIAIYSVGGMKLLDNTASEIGFTPSGIITADLTLEAGHLGALTVNGEPMSVGADAGRLQGGQLGALFEYRDETAIAQQAAIDSFALELANRLNDPSLDPTRTTGDIGFLTDNGALVESSDIVGLSSRLAVNSSIDPSKGGDPTLLRDGLLAVSTGPVGNASLLNDLSSALTAPFAIGQGSYAGESLGLDTIALRLTNTAAQSFDQAQQAHVFVSMQSETLRSYKLGAAVDSDAELQNLMMLEQAYAANAQVLRTVDEMMDTLLGII